MNVRNVGKGSRENIVFLNIGNFMQERKAISVIFVRNLLHRKGLYESTFSKIVAYEDIIVMLCEGLVSHQLGL